MTSDAPSSPRIQLLTSHGCHLCEQARRDLDDVTHGLGLSWEDVDITRHPELEDRYATEIPVVMVNGIPRDFWRIDTARLHGILEGLLRGRDPEGSDAP